MIKLLELLIEAAYWFLIFLSPMLIATVIAAVVYFSNGEQITIPVIILGTGLVIGDWCVAGRAHPAEIWCAAFYARLNRTGGDEKT